MMLFATTVLTQPAMKRSLFHYAIHKSHLGSGSPASRYFWYMLSQRLHLEKLLDFSYWMTNSVTAKSVLYVMFLWPTCVFI